jgi:hypothetical protein
MAESVVVRPQSPTAQAYHILHFAYVIAPLAAGIDKFFQLLTNWDQYLAPTVVRMLPVSGHMFMQAVGVVEIIAACLVAFVPRVGAWIVALWLLGIIVNLLMIPGYFDIALRDFGLLLGAVALARMSEEYA